jgi:hypothetical protein
MTDSRSGAMLRARDVNVHTTMRVRAIAVYMGMRMDNHAFIRWLRPTCDAPGKPLTRSSRHVDAEKDQCRARIA